MQARMQAVEMPAMAEIYLVREEADWALFTKVGRITKYHDLPPVPSATDKYAVMWQPQEAKAVFLLRNFSLAHRKVVDIRPETILGMIQVTGNYDVYVDGSLIHEGLELQAGVLHRLE